MIDVNKYESQLKSLRGKTIAIVYIFENEDAPGSDHYWVWKSDIISGWLNAVQELGCLPFILDVRTFIQKAINRTLPQIDFVVNLNCGSYLLSSMSLVPSMCSFIDIPCIPCNAISIVMSENKRVSNLLAEAKHLNVPKSISKSCENGIYRPLNLGSSIGVQKGHFENFTLEGTYQEFIPGYDLTIPIVYNPMIEKLDILPPILYFPKTKDPNWIYDEEAKRNDNDVIVLPVPYIEEKVKDEILEFARVFPIQTYGRIDVRLKCSEKELSKDIVDQTIKHQDLFFIEINSMPTIEANDSFEYALNALDKLKHYSFYNYFSIYKTLKNDITINGFLLSCSMLALLKPSIKLKQIKTVM
jgi:hypothetical protein